MDPSIAISDDDLVTVVSAASLTLLRRDMSLNRRFYAWLLGADITVLLHFSLHGNVVKNGHCCSRYGYKGRNGGTTLYTLHHLRGTHGLLLQHLLQGLSCEGT